MKRSLTSIFALWFFLIASGSVSYGQTTGALLPNIPPSFTSAAGIAASSAKLCAFAAGTTTPLAIYSDSALTTTLPNPNTLDAIGRPTTSGGTAAAIYIQPRNYKFILYAAGATGAACPLTGTAIWTRDNVYDAALLPAFDNVQLCDRHQGANAGAKIINCLAAQSVGVFDARGFTGAQTITSNISIGAGKTLLLGSATFTCTLAAICVTLSGSGAQLVGLAREQSVITQSSTAYPYSTLSITASNTKVSGVTLSGGVTAGTEADEGLASILITGALTTVSNTTIENSTLSSKVGGIFTYNSDATGQFKINGLVIRNNIIQALHYGIFVGGYLQSTILNNNITIDGNDVQVTALGSYASFQNARPLIVWNSNRVRVTNNKSIGGFSSYEIISSPATSLAHSFDNHIIGNIGDSHLSFTQVTNGSVTGNTIDMAARDAAWPAYDNATVVSAYGYLAGMEVADITNVAVTGNTVRNPVGAGIDFGQTVNCTLSGNTIYGAGTTASAPKYAGGIALNYILNDTSITGNSIQESATSGIWQWDTLATYTLNRVAISNNTIYRAGEHGIHVREATSVTITGNIITHVDLTTSGNGNGIDFSVALTGDIINSANVSNNQIGTVGVANSAGNYGIYQAGTDESSARSIAFYGNSVASPATAAYFVIGHKRDNTVATGTNPTVSIAASTHISVTGGIDTIQVDNSGGAHNLEFLDDGSVGDIVTLIFLTNDVTVVNSGNMLLAGSANLVTPAIGSILVLQNTQNFPRDAQEWREIGRTLR